jgi:hypothetical protein
MRNACSGSLRLVYAIGAGMVPIGCQKLTLALFGRISAGPPEPDEFLSRNVLFA